MGNDRITESLHRNIRIMRHELRTPLNQIIGYSELLQEEAQDCGQDSFIPDLQKICTAAHTMLSLIDTIFDFDSQPTEQAKPQLAQPKEEARPQLSQPKEQAKPQLSQPTEQARPHPEAHDREPDRKSADEAFEALPVPPKRDGPLLVVDDNEMNRDMLARRLKKQGYMVSLAKDGHEALEKLKAERFDLILLDVMMPEISGLDVLKTARQIYPATKLPIIMVTAKDTSEDIVEALNLGANDYVTKPLDFPVVLARVQTQLSLKRMTGEIEKLAEQLELRNSFIRKTFGRYLSHEVVESLLATPEGLHLGGEKRKVTVMMADLRGFSSIAEQLAPEKVVCLLNNFLGTMTGIIVRYQGTINEFIGDAILAIFGAPILRQDDAERALACAIEMQQTMTSVNSWNREHDLPRVAIGIGIHTGEAVVGNIGSHQRAKYAVVGSPVVHASRIESYTVGGQILISAQTLKEVESPVKIKTSLTVTPKGLPKPIELYDITGLGGGYDLSLSPGQEELVAVHRMIPIRYTVLKGKYCQEEIREGHLIKLSAEKAQLRLASPLPAMTNLKLILVEADGSAIPGDLYAKILSEDARLDHVDADQSEQGKHQAEQAGHSADARLDHADADQGEGEQAGHQGEQSGQAGHADQAGHACCTIAFTSIGPEAERYLERLREQAHES